MPIESRPTVDDVRRLQTALGIPADGIAGPQTAAALSATTLREGSTGEAVRALQEKLGLAPDGIDGPETTHAVKAFQQARGLRTDGVVGQATWQALRGAANAPAGGATTTPSPAPAKPGSSISQTLGNAVKATESWAETTYDSIASAIGGFFGGAKSAAPSSGPAGRNTAGTAPADVIQAALHRIAPSANANVSGASMVTDIVANGKDAIPTSTTPAAIERAVVENGTPVVVDGDVKNAAGVPSRQWAAIEGYDAKTKSFVVARPGAKNATEWSADQLKSFMNSADGGDAIAIDHRPEGAASQKQIDAIVATVPAEQRAYAKTAVPLILDECARQGVTDKGQIAYILSTTEHESRFGTPLYKRSVPLVEDSNPGDAVAYFDNKYNGMLGNRVGSDDGYTYRGRGYVQITGRTNYQSVGDTTGQDLIEHPDLARRPDIAAQNLVEGMEDAWYSGSGKGLADFVSGAKHDFYDARTTVNGYDDADDIAARAQDYLAALQ